MPQDPIDQAIDTAVDMTQRANNDVIDAADEHIPPLPLVRTLEHRADDLHQLAGQAAEQAQARPMAFSSKGRDRGRNPD